MDKELLYRFLEYNCTPEEDVEVCEWIAASPENRKEFEELELIFTATLIHTPPKNGKSKPERKNISILRKTASWMGWAAAAVALAFILNNALPFGGADRMAKFYSIEVPPGERMKINLTDGTEVWLNGGTKLEYPAVFSKKFRRVTVSGEALFEVAHDAKCPFYIETFACEIMVLGTKFNVVADKESDTFQTALLDGSLKVSCLIPGFTGNEVLLQPGELAVYNNGRLSIRPIDDHAAYSWVDGIINIRGLDFEAIMARLEKAFDVKIVIERNNTPTMDFIGGEFRTSYGIENVLNILQYGSDFRYEFDKEKNIITIY